MGRNDKVAWDKLDNTALLFPVIATQTMTNVYRISSELSENIDRDLLQEALDRILPSFDVFRMRLRAGLFWYYFEENKRKAPLIREEYSFPGAYINKSRNNHFMFRVTYYEKRINLEVFHALTDGFGGVVFLKELVYQYLRLKYSEELADEPDKISNDVFLDKEDSYIKNYKKPGKDRKKYKHEKAVIVTGESFPGDEVGVIHGFMPIAELKAACKRYGVTINKFLTGVYVYSIYKEYLGGHPSEDAISCGVPVNLRPYYDSHTMKNFFVILAAEFRPEIDDYSFEEVLSIVCESLDRQMTKENLDDIISYNVSNEMNMTLRVIPLFIKNLAIKQVYAASSHSNTTTLTNIGNIVIREPYKQYVKGFSCLLSMSEGQNIKASVCSYDGVLNITFSSILTDTSIQRRFFQTLTKEGVPVAIQTNGIYE